MRDADVKRLAAQVTRNMAAPTQHDHQLSEIFGLLALLALKADVGHEHQYEASGAVAAHEAANDPHPDYLKQAEADARYAAADHEHPGGPGAAPEWGVIQGTLGDQADLRAALDAKSDVHSHPYADEIHGHTINVITGLQEALDGKQASGSYEPANANIQQHVAQAHAPANAQKNSDITKAEIEAKLTGELTSHTHPAAASGSDPWTYKRLPADFTISTTAAGDVTNGGVLFGFTPAAGKSYTWEAVLGLRSATATVNPRCGFAWATGMTDGVCSIEQTSTATAKIMVNGNIAAPLLMAVGGIPTNSTSWPAICYGNVLTGANPSGNCRMQLASETAGTVVRVVAAVSYFRFRELP